MSAVFNSNREKTCYNGYSYMQERDRYRIIYKIGASFSTNLAAGYIFATSLSPNLWTLTNNILFCILCLYTAYKFEQFSDYA